MSNTNIRTEYVPVKFEVELRKDLQENEEICEACGGLGLQIYHNEYGLRSEGERFNFNNPFPFKRQDLGSCHHCYHGVRKRCEFCGNLVDRNYTYCQCDKSKVSRGKSDWQIEQAAWDKAIKLKADDEIAKSMGMYYSGNYPYSNGYFHDIDQFMEYWEGEVDEDEEKPRYIWGTSSIKLSLDADSILENATDDLHEEALSNIGDKDMDELRDFLNGWCEKQSGTTTYYEDNTYAIEIPW